MKLNDLPLDVLIVIAEYDDEVWFKLSILIKDFSVYAISPGVKIKAMKNFNISEYEKSGNCWKTHYYCKDKDILKKQSS